jgi:hypothetical protein
MRKIEVRLYVYDELNEAAQERAREWYREAALDYDWWDGVEEDAANVGLKLDSFDLSRYQISLDWQSDCSTVAKKIIEDHGDCCSTYKAAMDYLSSEKKDDDEARFIGTINHAYFTMLQEEYEYLLSDEHVEEAIIANDYEFLDTGKRFG